MYCFANVSGNVQVRSSNVGYTIHVHHSVGDFNTGLFQHYGLPSSKRKVGEMLQWYMSRKLQRRKVSIGHELYLGTYLLEW